MTATKDTGMFLNDSMHLVLRTLGENGEIIESECYDRGIGVRRISATMRVLSKTGMVTSRTREHGQRVPVYSLTTKGELLRMLYEATDILVNDGGEIDLDESIVEQLRTTLAGNGLGRGRR